MTKELILKKYIAKVKQKVERIEHLNWNITSYNHSIFIK